LAACKEAKTSPKLHKILEFVLAIGNYMNGSTSRGEAFGYKLDSLIKVSKKKKRKKKDFEPNKA